MKRPWSNRELTLLHDLFKEGYSAATIAQHLGRSTSAINHRLDRIGRQKLRTSRIRCNKKEIPRHHLKKIHEHQQVLQKMMREKEQIFRLNEKEQKERRAKHPPPDVDLAQLLFILRHRHGHQIKVFKNSKTNERQFQWEDKILTAAQLLTHFNKIRISNNQKIFHVKNISQY